MVLLVSPALLAVFAALFGLVYYMVARLASPLHRVPGPTYSLFTSLVLRWYELRAQRTQYIHGLHQLYGAVVRIAPNEVAFASAAAVKEIYCSGGSGYDKTEFYDLFKVFGRRTMFTTLNKNDHAKRKRLLADGYANSNITRKPSLSGIEERSRKFVALCNESVGKWLEIYVALHAYAFDCVTHHLFHPHGSNSLQSKEDEEVMREVAFDDSLQNRLIQYYTPTLHKLISRALYVFAKPRETPLADAFVLTNSAKGQSAAPFTMLSRLGEKRIADADRSLDAVDIASECLDHMAAGIDTTGDGLCFLMWELSQPHSLTHQRRLQDELRAHKTGDVPFDRLPFLDAVVLEGLRCFPPIPMSLPRHVPRGGRIIDGYTLPEKTIVSCQAYSVHRINTDVFPQPDAFDPDRWLQPEGDAERKRAFFAFANGGRGCIGKHLATAEMKTLLRDVYSRFTTLPAIPTTAEMMEMSDQLISSRPVGQWCCLSFIPLEDVAEKV